MGLFGKKAAAPLAERGDFTAAARAVLAGETEFSGGQQAVAEAAGEVIAVCREQFGAELSASQARVLELEASAPDAAAQARALESAQALGQERGQAAGLALAVQLLDAAAALNLAAPLPALQGALARPGDFAARKALLVEASASEVAPVQAAASTKLEGGSGGAAGDQAAVDAMAAAVRGLRESGALGRRVVV